MRPLSFRLAPLVLAALACASAADPVVLDQVDERLHDHDAVRAATDRYAEDLRTEGWEVHLRPYDVRSAETGERGHRHLPAEVLDLYRSIRTVWREVGASLAGVVLVGDFPAAGIAHIQDVQIGDKLEQHEMDYFCVDAMLADPTGYWEWLPLAPTLPPGSPETMRLPFDEGRHPGGSLYPRTEWSAPAFVLLHRSEVAHADRTPGRFGAVPRFWVGRVSAAQTAWVTGPDGWEWSAQEEVRQLVEFFERNHAHRTSRREPTGYLFLDRDFAGDWPAGKARMAAAVPAERIRVQSDDPAFAPVDQATFAGYLESFRGDYLFHEASMHSDRLNHYFAGLEGSDDPPADFPDRWRFPGSEFEVEIPRGSLQAGHLRAIPGASTLPRFYLLAGCDLGDILHRCPMMVDGQHISPETPLARMYGAYNLGLSYLMLARGLAVLCHNVTNPPGDWAPVYRAMGEGRSFGDGVLEVMRAENDAGLPHYRNVIFGDPTLRLEGAPR